MTPSRFVLPLMFPWPDDDDALRLSTIFDGCGSDGELSAALDDPASVHYLDLLAQIAAEIRDVPLPEDLDRLVPVALEFLPRRRTGRRFTAPLRVAAPLVAALSLGVGGWLVSSRPPDSVDLSQNVATDSARDGGVYRDLGPFATMEELAAALTGPEPSAPAAEKGSPVELSAAAQAEVTPAAERSVMPNSTVETPCRLQGFATASLPASALPGANRPSAGTELGAGAEPDVVVVLVRSGASVLLFAADSCVPLGRLVE